MEIYEEVRWANDLRLSQEDNDLKINLLADGFDSRIFSLKGDHIMIQKDDGSGSHFGMAPIELFIEMRKDDGFYV